MEDFSLVRPDSLQEAAAAGATPGAAFIAGGTDLLQLMKQEVARPTRLVDLDGLLPDEVEVGPDTVRIGALARMSDVAAHPAIRQNFRAVSEALLSAASPQVRNMGTVGGNLLQRTRCNYFRDPGFASCNKRDPGSGCAALHGESRLLGILGTSDACIATHPSDMPVALAAFDAAIEVQDGNGARRTLQVAELYRLPGDTPNVETNLRLGEVITAILLPRAPVRQSRYIKIRDRASFEFALVSCAVALDAQGGVVRDARVALGGVAHMPWRAHAVEEALRSRPVSTQTFAAAASRAGEGARPTAQNAFKVKLAERAVRRALQAASA